MGVQINGSEGNVIATKGTYSGNVTIGGTLTYEDVTNIDSVGLVTARTGIEIGARPGVAASISADGNMIVSGISTFGGTANFAAISGTTGTFSGDVDIADKIVHTGDTNTALRFPAADTITAETAGSERLRIDSTGSLFAGGTPLTESDLNWNHDTYQRPHIFSGNTGGTPSDGAIVAATVTENPSDSRIGAIIFGCKTSSTSGVSNSGLKAFIEGCTNTNVSDAWKTGGYMKFSTRADNGTTPDERLRIQSTGVVNIGDTTASALGDRLLQIGKTDRTATYVELRTATNGVGGVVWSDGTDNSNTGYRGTIEYAHGGSNSDSMFFKTAATERIRILSDGTTLINATTVNGGGAAPKLAVDGGDSNLHTINVQAGGGENNGDLAGISFSHGNTGDIARPKAAIALNRTGSYGIGDLCFYVDNGQDNNPVSSGDEKMRLSKEGYLTTPSTVSFQAYGGGNWSSGNYLVLTNTNWNDGNGYNTSNGVFTAPVTGTYLFTITGLYTLNTSSPPHKYTWHVNNVNSGVLAEWQDGSIASSYNTIGNSSIIFKLSATDTVRIYIESSVAHISGGQTRYCGHLIG